MVMPSLLPLDRLLTKNATVMDLPYECLIEIFSYLPPEQLGKCACVCRFVSISRCALACCD